VILFLLFVSSPSKASLFSDFPSYLEVRSLFCFFRLQFDRPSMTHPLSLCELLREMFGLSGLLRPFRLFEFLLPSRSFVCYLFLRFWDGECIAPPPPRTVSPAFPSQGAASRCQRWLLLDFSQTFRFFPFRLIPYLDI